MDKEYILKSWLKKEEGNTLTDGLKINIYNYISNGERA